MGRWGGQTGKHFTEAPSTSALNKSYEAGMAPPIGGVDRGGRRRDFSFADMAAISGSWVSYIFTSLANLRTPMREERST